MRDFLERESEVKEIRADRHKVAAARMPVVWVWNLGGAGEKWWIGGAGKGGASR